jgi:hypothetical protein
VLLLPLTLLTDRSKLRLSGYVSMGMIGMLWLGALGLIVAESSRAYRYEDYIGMSLGFTLLMGLPAALAALLVSFRWARWAVIGFVSSAGLCWLLVEFGVLTRLLIDDYLLADHIIETSLTFYGIGTCLCELLVNIGCGDRRYFRWVGISAALLAALLFFLLIWADVFMPRPQTIVLLRAACLFLIPAIVLGHINLLLMARLRSAQTWLQRFTIGAAIAGGVAAIPIPFINFPYDPVIEVLARFTVAFGIATASGSVALIVLSMLNRKPALQLAPGALTATEVTLFCPRCQTRQTLALGDSTCKNCELLISIKVIEPRCPACGYLLYQLTSAKCPECGAQIREGETSGSASAVNTEEISGKLGNLTPAGTSNP